MEGARAHSHVWPSWTGRLASCVWHKREVSFLDSIASHAHTPEEKSKYFHCQVCSVVSCYWGKGKKSTFAPPPHPLNRGCGGGAQGSLLFPQKFSYKGGQLYPFGNQFQARENILESYKTLTDKNMMGARFKVLRSSQIECWRWRNPYQKNGSNHTQQGNVMF